MKQIIDALAELRETAGDHSSILLSNGEMGLGIRFQWFDGDGKIYQHEDMLISWGELKLANFDLFGHTLKRQNARVKHEIERQAVRDFMEAVE